MIPSPIYQNSSSLEQKDNKKTNLCYIVTPSTPSVTLTTAATSSISSTIMNNYDQKYMDSTSSKLSQSIVPVDHSPYMKQTSYIDMSNKSNNNTIVNSPYIDNNQKGNMSYNTNTIQHNSNIPIMENSSSSVQIQQQPLTFIQKNTGLLSPTNSNTSLSSSNAMSNQRMNDSNIIFSTSTSPSYILNTTSSIFNQNSGSGSQPVIIKGSYNNSYPSQSSPNGSNNQPIQTGYIQQIPNNSPMVQSPQVITSVPNNNNQQSIQLGNPQMQGPSQISQVQPMTYPSPVPNNQQAYSQSTIINNYYNDNNVQYNNNIQNQQNKVNNGVMYSPNNNTNNYSTSGYSVTPINSTIAIPLNNQNQNMSNPNSSYNSPVISQQVPMYNNNNQQAINNYGINLVANTIPQNNAAVNNYPNNPVKIENFSSVNNNGMVINQNNNYQNNGYQNMDFYNQYQFKKGSKDDVRQQKVRFKGDIYTPKLVRYTGNAKEGFCDQCNPGRWLQLKNSAYWYHKQFFHGISSVSGKPFHPPIATKVLDYNEMLEAVNDSDNKKSKKDSSSSSSKSDDKDNLSAITSNEEFLKAFKDLIAESTISLPEGFNLNDCILKFVVGLCHHCKEWVPLMITKKRSSQFFTNILKYKQNDNFILEKSKKNGKPLNKYYLKKKYNMYNDKKNITEIIISYLQQVKQNRKEINDIINNNGMTILWYRHAHKCHQYLRPKVNIDEISTSNKTETSTTTSAEPVSTVSSTENSSSLINNDETITTTNTAITTTTTTTATLNNENSVSTTMTSQSISTPTLSPDLTNNNANNNQNISSPSMNTINYSTVNQNSTPVYSNNSTYPSPSSTVATPNINNNNNSTPTINNSSLVNEITYTTTVSNNQILAANYSNIMMNSNNKRVLTDDNIYNDYRQTKKEKMI